MPDSIARFPQGTKKFAEYVLKELKIPQLDQEKMTGFEWCKFILSYDSLGKLKKAERDPSHEYHHLEPIFLTFFRQMPDWKPAAKGGEPVSCRLLLELTIYNDPTLPMGKDAVSVFERPNGNEKYLCDKFYNQGVACFAKANYSAALVYFNKAVQVKPDDVDSWFNKGISHYKLNDIGRACESWEAIIKMGKGDPEIEDLVRKNCPVKKKEIVSQKGNSEVFTSVEVNAEFPGGISEMLAFMRKNTNYPESLRYKHVGGQSFLKFVVDEDGNITNTEVFKSSGVLELDNEAVRVVSMMPKWTPAQMAGKNVKCYFNLPFLFSFSEPYYFFNPDNKNESYVLAWQALLSNKSEKALELYSLDTEDVEAWYNIAVIHFYKNNKKEAKKYFEKVENTADPKSQYYVLSEKFLKNNF